MESRFRKFIGARRGKTSLQPIKICSSDDAQLSAASNWPLPVLEPQSHLTHEDNKQSMLEPEETGLRAMPYDIIPAGKAPVFTSAPIKGNGPIRLQANRRSSSGELEATLESYTGLLDDIRDGDYIVGRKLVLNSRCRSVRSPTPQSTPALSYSSHTESFQSPRPAPSTPTSPSSLVLLEIPEHCSQHHLQTEYPGLGLSTPSMSSFQTNSSQYNFMPPDLNRASRSSQVSTTTTPSVQVADEHNATIAALWKAEYNQLVDLYGRDHVERRMPNLVGGRIQTSTPMNSCRSHARIQMPEGDLQPLSSSNVDKHSIIPDQRDSHLATNTCSDDNSDTLSNKRTSLVSSCAGSSSHTTQTSVTEHDIVTTRDDIRKIINEMRSTYLRALDAQSPPVTRSSQTTKKKRRSKLGPSVKKRSVKHLSGLDRQTWHGNNRVSADIPEDEYSKMRAASHPVTGFGRLSPVESSPEPLPNKRPTARLQRADSGTLGSLIAQIKSEIEIIDPEGKVRQASEHRDIKHTEDSELDNALCDEGTNTISSQQSNNLAPNVDTQMPVVRPQGNFF